MGTFYQPSFFVSFFVIKEWEKFCSWRWNRQNLIIFIPDPGLEYTFFVKTISIDSLARISSCGMLDGLDNLFIIRSYSLQDYDLDLFIRVNRYPKYVDRTA